MNFFVYQVQKRSLYVSGLQKSFIFKHILLGDIAYVSDLCNKYLFSLLMVYSHRETNENPAKKKSNVPGSLIAKRSTLKPYNSKTSTMTPDFLYNFLTLLQSRH
jgi:hypothetical protein